jgi:predicted transcriptional regulator
MQIDRLDSDALGNPVRRRIYMALCENDRALSSVEMALLLQITLAQANYHLSVLVDTGKARRARIELVGDFATGFYEAAGA